MKTECSKRLGWGVFLHRSQQVPQTFCRLAIVENQGMWQDDAYQSVEALQTYPDAEHPVPTELPAGIDAAGQEEGEQRRSKYNDGVVTMKP